MSKIPTLIILENEEGRLKHYNLFAELLKNIIVDVRKDYDFELETDTWRLQFVTKSEVKEMRHNYKVHYALNLTQDIDFHNQVVLPMSTVEWISIHNEN